MQRAHQSRFSRNHNEPKTYLCLISSTLLSKSFHLPELLFKHSWYFDLSQQEIHWSTTAQNHSCEPAWTAGLLESLIHLTFLLWHHKCVVRADRPLSRNWELITFNMWALGSEWILVLNPYIHLGFSKFVHYRTVNEHSALSSGAPNVFYEIHILWDIPVVNELFQISLWRPVVTSQMLHLCLYLSPITLSSFPAMWLYNMPIFSLQVKIASTLSFLSSTLHPDSVWQK